MPQLNVTTVSSTGTIKSTGVMQAGTGFRLPSFTNSNRPASPNTGTVIWNSTEGTIQVWNGTSYIAVASSGVLNAWATGARPSSPSVGTLGWNTTDGKFEVYNGVDANLNTPIWVQYGSTAGLTQDNPAPTATAIQDAGITTNGLYWIQPSGASAAEQVYVDFGGGESGITDSGPWVRVRYAQNYYSRSSPWSGQSGRTDPTSESGTAYSGNFAFEQSESWIENLLDDSDDVRQIFESWGYGSVGWTYQGNNAYMEGRGIDDVNYTRWGGNGGTHTGVSGGRLSGMSHNISSINGPYNNPTGNNTDSTDQNDSTWRYGRFYFRYTGSPSAAKPLPIKGVYNADVDGSSEQRYFPFRSAAGGWSGQGESTIWIKN